ncbi:DNA-binding SARP family transcriptional activator/tetratricopeptide (TPR) repeat protein [Catenulispora sp. GP43]|uniref:AfsR/SARP family transcriptional regulator n=1 Tax=Catenulispora sp. GP43 TaxID=3156263 RepID=UPI003515F809
MATDEYRVDLLGPPRIHVVGEPIDLGGPRQEKLLTLLVLEADRVLPVEALVDALWDEDPPATARRQVHNAVSELRRRLGPAREVVVSHRYGYRACVSARNVDVHRFRELVAVAGRAASDRRPAEAIAAFDSALGLWRGSALAGMEGPAMRLAAARLEEERLAAVEQLVGLRLDLGGGPDYVPVLRELVAEHPFRDPFRGQLMLALYRSGRQAEALEVYERGRAQLAGDLGLDMRAGLRHLHESILRNDPSLDAPCHAASAAAAVTAVVTAPEPPPPPEPQKAIANQPLRAEQIRTSPGENFLPCPVRDFVGRENELEGLTRILVADPEGAGVVCVDGMAGAGKTALALQAAHLVADRFPDGQFFLDLRAHSPSQGPLPPATALDWLLRAAGYGPEIPADPAQQTAAWRALLAGRRALVVLDDALDARQVRPLIPGAGRSMVLVTSRTRLLDLEAADVCSLDMLSEQDAAALFTRIVGDARSRAEPAAVAAIIGFCDRLPLAIRIAAARLRHRPGWSVADLADRLRDGAGLTELVAGDRSVAGAFEVSYRRLGQPDQEVFRALSLHPGRDFDAAAAAALAGLPTARAAACLERLVDVNLLGQDRFGRYRMPALIRRYAVGKALRCDSPERREAALDRLRSHYRRLAVAAMTLADPGSGLWRDIWDRTEEAKDVAHTAHATHTGYAAHTPDTGLPRTVDDVVTLLRDERANLTAVIGLTASGPHREQTCQLAVATASLLVHGGYAQEALPGLELAVRDATAADDLRGRAAARLHTGLALRTLGRHQEAAAALTMALAEFDALGDRQGMSRTLRNLGCVHHVRGDFDKALCHYRRALDLAREIDAGRDEAAALGNIGSLLGCMHKHEEALWHHEQALTRSEELANPYLQVIALTNIGVARSRLGEGVHARTALKHALELAARIGARHVEAGVCCSIADLLHREGDHAGALPWAQRALAVAEQSENPILESTTWNLIGRLQFGLGDLASARAGYLRALALCRDRGIRYEEAVAWEGLAAVARGDGDPEIAGDYADQAVAMFHDADSDRAAAVLAAALAAG